MEESLKSRIILILSILVIIFLVGAVGSCNNARQLKTSRDKEMVTRLDLEEKMSKFTQEKSSAEKQINSISQALEQEKQALEATKKDLLQEQLMNKSLTEELEKLTKLKEKLEEDLKEALIVDKSARQKK